MHFRLTSKFYHIFFCEQPHHSLSVQAYSTKNLTPMRKTFLTLCAAILTSLRSIAKEEQKQGIKPTLTMWR